MRKVEPELSTRAKQLLAQMRAIDTSNARSAGDAFDLPAASQKNIEILMATTAALDNGEITVRQCVIISK